MNITHLDSSNTLIEVNKKEMDVLRFSLEHLLAKFADTNQDNEDSRNIFNWIYMDKNRNNVLETLVEMNEDIRKHF